MTENQPGRGRRWAGWIVTALAVLTLALSVPVLWLHQTLLTTDGYVRVVEDLPADPAALGRRRRSNCPAPRRPSEPRRPPQGAPARRDRSARSPRSSSGSRIGWASGSPASSRARTSRPRGRRRTRRSTAELFEFLRGDPGVVELQGAAGHARPDRDHRRRAPDAPGRGAPSHRHPASCRTPTGRSRRRRSMCFARAAGTSPRTSPRFRCSRRRTWALLQTLVGRPTRSRCCCR